MAEYDFNQWMTDWPNPIVKQDLQGDYPREYLGLAQAMMFNLKSMMRLGGLKQYQMTRQLGDGSVVTVGSVYGQDLVKITTPISKPVTVEEGSFLYGFKIIRDDGTVITGENASSLDFEFHVYNPGNDNTPHSDFLNETIYSGPPINRSADSTLTYNGSDIWIWKLTDKGKLNPLAGKIPSEGLWFTFNAKNCILVQYNYKYKSTDLCKVEDLLKPGTYTVNVPYFDIESRIIDGDPIGFLASAGCYYRLRIACSVPVKIIYYMPSAGGGSTTTFRMYEPEWPIYGGQWPSQWTNGSGDGNQFGPCTWDPNSYVQIIYELYNPGPYTPNDPQGISFYTREDSGGGGDSTHSVILTPGITKAEYWGRAAYNGPDSTTVIQGPLTGYNWIVDLVRSYAFSHLVGAICGFTKPYWHLDGYREWKPSWKNVNDTWAGAQAGIISDPNW